MASGKQHAAASKWVGKWGAVAAFLIAYDITYAAAFYYGAKAGIYLTPDLDVNRRTYIEYKLTRHRLFVVRVLGWLFTAYWYPYGLLVPHRHWVSHKPIIGTAIRLMYGFWWVVFIPPPNVNSEVAFWLWHLLLWWMIGLVCSDIAHSVFDSRILRNYLKNKRKSGTMNHNRKY